MPVAAASEMMDSESRTASVGRHASAGATATTLAPSTSTSTLYSSTSSPRSTSSRKRRRGKKKSSDVKDFVPMGANFSKSSELLPHSTSDSTNTEITSISTPQPVLDHEVELPNMGTSTSSLGKNRLATGFSSSPISARTPNIDNSRTLSHSSHDTSGGGSKDDAIEISSDEEMEDSEGGMIVNVHDNVPDLTTSSVSEDEGMVTPSDDDDIVQIHENLTRAANVKDLADATSSNLRLLDLGPEDLEVQIRYGFYHLDRTQVDLNRLVICLFCMGLGHLVSECPEATCKHCEEGSHPSGLCPRYSRCRKCRDRGHSSQECLADLKVTTVPCDVCGRLSHVEQDCPDRHFYQPKLQGPARLWISCSICASKSHLVGDCPDAPVNASTARWSLKELDPRQITNLSLESGTRQLEQVAETRGMRPAGMQIRGRAGLHHAGTARSGAPSDDDGDFLRPAVGRTNQPPKPQVRLGNYEPRRPSPSRGDRSDRYDRFEAPSFDGRGQNRGRGAWYDTDSFGRRRSRSPVLDSYRPGSRRSPSPRRFDGYAQSDHGYRGPPQSDYWRPIQNGLPPRPPPSRGDAGPTMPAPSRPFQLPTRKGSNPNLPSKPSTVAQNSQQSQGAHKSRAKKNKKGKGKGPGQADSDTDGVDDGGDFSALGSLTANDFDFSSNGTICLDLPDNLQAWLDKINSKRKRKGHKPLFVSEVEDNPRPSEMKIHDAQTGQTSKMQAGNCDQIASKGFRLLGKPDQVNVAAQPQPKESPKDASATPAGVTHRYFLRPRRNGVFSKDATTQPGPSENKAISSGKDSLIQPAAGQTKKLPDPSQLRSTVVADDMQPKAVQIPGPSISDRLDIIARTPGTTSTKSQKIELGAWLELENRLRRAQKKGPITIKRAHTLDSRGHYIHSYLIDPATGSYQAVRDRRYGEMRMIDALLRLQTQQHGARGGMFPELEEYLSSMRGQALPQSAPIEVSKAIHEGTRKAVSEGRQIIMSNLPLDVTAVRIDRFFAGFDVESIAMAFDSITEMPTGTAYVDMETTKDADAALERLSGKSIMAKKVDLRISALTESEIPSQPAETEIHAMHSQGSEGKKADITMTDALPAAEGDHSFPGGGPTLLTEEFLPGLREAAELSDDPDETGQTEPAIPPETRTEKLSRKGTSRFSRLQFYLEMANQERAASQLGKLTQAPVLSKRHTQIVVHDPDTRQTRKVYGDDWQKVNKWDKVQRRTKRKPALSLLPKLVGSEDN